MLNGERGVRLIKDNRKKYMVIDPENGELVGIRHEGDKVIPQRIYENWVSIYGQEQADKGCEPLNIGKYAKVSDTAMMVMRNMKFTSLEFKIMFYLMPMIHWDSNLVAYKNRKPITTATLAKAFTVNDGKENAHKITEKTIDAALRGLKKKGVIFIGNTGGSVKTFFNPYVFFKGRFIAKTLKEMFADTEFYKAWAELPINKYYGRK